MNDRKLIEQFVSGNDHNAFAELVSRHGPLVMRICSRFCKNEQDAEDAFQAVFIVLAKRARAVSWQPSIANWLYGVALRVARRSARHVAKRSEVNVDIEQIPSPIKKENSFNEAEEHLHNTLEKMPAKYREPLVLCHLQGKSRSQAANDLGLSESIVKGRLERGRNLLRKRLGAKHDAVWLAFSTGVLSTQISEAASNTSTLELFNQTVLGSLAESKVSLVSSSAVEIANGEIGKMIVYSQMKIVVFVGCLLAVAGTSVALIVGPTTMPAGPTENSEIATATTVDSSEEEQDIAAKRHLQAIARAVLAYVEDHNGLLPPAEVPNPNLDPDKRLSGLVLLLPYLGVRLDFIDENDPEWLAWHPDNERAKALFKQIDLTKAWDDPANRAAAMTVVEEFLAPGSAAVKNDQGYAFSHFAFVRGNKGRDNGAFPLNQRQPISFAELRDGTSNTIGLGQISRNLGPWIAAGSSTARFLDHPSTKTSTPGFGSRIASTAYFANCDSFVYLLDIAASDPRTIAAYAGRDDQMNADYKKLARYGSMTEWQQAKDEKQ